LPEAPLLTSRSNHRNIQASQVRTGKTTPEIELINENIFDFNAKLKFDSITIFGFAHYLNRDEAHELYARSYSWLKKCGKIIVKNQFGANEDVTVSGYSEELKSTYFAQYRHLNTEMQLLIKSNFVDIEIFDMYPPESNRWENTHFFAITADN
jgi:cyclopropane fatty-acyl-phospholipid synthase-like methyltransferase